LIGVGYIDLGDVVVGADTPAVPILELGGVLMITGLRGAVERLRTCAAAGEATSATPVAIRTAFFIAYSLQLPALSPHHGAS
jgi:hypothetical protein